MQAADELPADYLERLSAWIAPELFSLLTLEERAKPVQLTESFIFHSIRRVELVPDLFHFEENATWIIWHHQIRVAQQSLLFARSKEGRSGSSFSMEPIEVVRSDTAKRIDSVIKWIDGNVEGHLTARMFEIIPYLVIGFLLVRGNHSEIIVADFPPQFKILKRNERYSVEAFLAVMALQLEAVNFNLKS